MKRPKLPQVRVRLGRFLVLFAIFMIIGFGLFLAPFIQPVVLAFSRGLVNSSASLIHFFGGRAKPAGTVLRSDSGFAVEMQNGCNGVDITILLCAAIAA